MQLTPLAFSALALLTFSATNVVAECPNACSGHGDCTTWDKCECYRNWQAADCSQRTCPYGLAHVDTPKGDLNHDNEIDLPSENVYVYDIYGTTGTTQEGFPSMKDSAGTVLTETAHYYMECSNKGLCNRDAGLCECFPGYDGHACQRASCPNDCSGHGTCHTIKDIAALDWGNVYQLWDKDMTMGCVCDPQYTGADCSLKQCKYGIDPLYTNNYNTANMPAWRYKLGPTTGNLFGTYAIKFYDVFDEDYITEPIVFDGATTNPIEDALEALPNSVVPQGSVAVSFTADSGGATKGGEYKVTFKQNPGALKQIEILKYLDGTRPTLYDDSGLDWLSQLEVADSSVFSDGQPGEYLDYFYTLCEGVKTKITRIESGGVLAAHLSGGATARDEKVFHGVAYLSDLTTAEEKLLKTCLGDSDGDWTNNVDVENWDYGDWSYRLAVKQTAEGGTSLAPYTVGTTNAGAITANNVLGVTASTTSNNAMVGQFPHAIKLVPVSQTDTKDGGHIYLVWYDAAMTTPKFKLLSNPPAFKDDGNTIGWTGDETDEEFYIFTTDGKTQLVQTIQPNWGDATINADASSNNADDWNDFPVFAWFEKYSNVIYTSVDASCETGNTNSTKAFDPTTVDNLANVRSEDNLVNCLQKGDKIFVTDGAWGDETVPTATHRTWAGNDRSAQIDTPDVASEYTGLMYTIKKIWVEPAGNSSFDATFDLQDRYRIMVDKAINWDGSDFGDPDGDGVYDTGYQYLFKFTPNTSYSYVSECANRGLCNRESGVCECFTGYTNDNCDTQSSLAV